MKKVVYVHVNMLVEYKYNLQNVLYNHVEHEQLNRSFCALFLSIIMDAEMSHP